MTDKDLIEKMAQNILASGFYSDPQHAWDLANEYAKLRAIDQARATHTAIKAAGYAVVPVEQWQPIETAPKDGTKILIYGIDPNDGEYINTAEYQERHDMFMHNYSTTVGHSYLTHWMRLPTPPEGGRMMAHECPECYANCHCGGDIEDMNYGYKTDCTHCDCDKCHQMPDYCTCEEPFEDMGYEQ